MEPADEILDEREIAKRERRIREASNMQRSLSDVLAPFAAILPARYLAYYRLRDRVFRLASVVGETAPATLRYQDGQDGVAEAAGSEVLSLAPAASGAAANDDLARHETDQLLAVPISDPDASLGGALVAHARTSADIGHVGTQLKLVTREVETFLLHCEHARTRALPFIYEEHAGQTQLRANWNICAEAGELLSLVLVRISLVYKRDSSVMDAMRLERDLRSRVAAVIRRHLVDTYDCMLNGPRGDLVLLLRGRNGLDGTAMCNGIFANLSEISKRWYDHQDYSVRFSFGVATTTRGVAYSRMAFVELLHDANVAVSDAEAHGGDRVCTASRRVG